MNKFILTILFSCLSFGIVMAQEDTLIGAFGVEIGDFRNSKEKGTISIEAVLRDIPQNLLFLGSDQKEELLASVDSTILVAENPFGREMKRLSISNDYMALQTSEKGLMQIKILSLINDSKIICIVKTVCGSVCDSQVDFYTDKWVALKPKTILPKFTLDWFLKPNVNRNGQEFKNVTVALSIRPYNVTLYPNKTDMRVHFDIWNYVSEEDKKLVDKIITKEAVILKWDKASFEK